MWLCSTRSFLVHDVFLRIWTIDSAPDSLPFPFPHLKESTLQQPNHTSQSHKQLQTNPHQHLETRIQQATTKKDLGTSGRYAFSASLSPFAAPLPKISFNELLGFCFPSLTFPFKDLAPRSPWNECLFECAVCGSLLLGFVWDLYGDSWFGGRDIWFPGSWYHA